MSVEIDALIDAFAEITPLLRGGSLIKLVLFASAPRLLADEVKLGQMLKFFTLLDAQQGDGAARAWTEGLRDAVPDTAPIGLFISFVSQPNEAFLIELEERAANAKSLNERFIAVTFLSVIHEALISSNEPKLSSPNKVRFVRGNHPGVVIVA